MQAVVHRQSFNVLGLADMSLTMCLPSMPGPSESM